MELKTESKVILTDMKEVVKRVLHIMGRHIGEENKISKMTLFREVYGTSVHNVSELHEYMMWEGIRRAMHRCRQRTKCFIVSKCFPMSQYSVKNQGVWYYWVANSFSDCEVYKANIERNIKAMRNMEKRAFKSVQNKWYEEEWEYQ